MELGIAGVSGAWVLVGYDHGLGAALARAKVRRDRPWLAEAGALLARRAGPMLAGARLAAVIPAPSTPWSRLTRGFAGAAVLAEAVAREVGAPLRHVLFRRSGSRQATLGRSGRASNLAGRVRCEVPLSGEVLLVDDVITTGATVAACTTELLGAGAARVWVLALCRVR